MACPYLAYRSATDDREFDTERAYCTAADKFVQPMRADVCNDRYDLSHEAHCEIFREAASGAAAGDAEQDR
ncbi:hypothetical protein [Haloparvum sp. PAK95]|uniref:hypothetical protein n=1 Tax=Haloparvum sp. PAK95 TaxID=3418962 RepID=UPI003D2F440F